VGRRRIRENSGNGPPERGLLMAILVSWVEKRALCYAGWAKAAETASAGPIPSCCWAKDVWTDGRNTGTCCPSYWPKHGTKWNIQPPDESNISVNWKQICSVCRSPTPGWQDIRHSISQNLGDRSLLPIHKIIMAEIQNKARTLETEQKLIILLNQPLPRGCAANGGGLASCIEEPFFRITKYRFHGRQPG
jgi:hypothetical protein